MFEDENANRLECFKCGVAFWMTRRLYDTCYRTKQAFWCPNGHAQAFLETEADRLRQQLASAERTIGQLRESEARLRARVLHRKMPRSAS